MARISIKSINDRILDNAKEYIDECEQVYNDRIREVADNIRRDHQSRPVILLSGPSGAGKTTTALKIEALLDAEGLETHTLSMDNYFTPHDGKSEIDLEAPARLDIELLQNHLVKIANCEEIEVPIFNFKTQNRDGFTPLKRKKNELVLIEGIHALNPDVTGYGADFTQRIYVCPTTGISTGRDLVLHTAQIRLLRRLTRDHLFRGRSFDDTLFRFSDVERGTNLYILPYKNRADFTIDTFLPYEICAYRQYDLELLGEIDSSSKNKPHAKELYDILSMAAPVSEDLIPAGSLVREFIGKSSFNY